MKAALIALALLAPLPAAAATVVVDYNPDVMEIQFPAFYMELEDDYARGAYHTILSDRRDFYNSFPTGTLFVETNTSPGAGQFETAFYFSYDGYGGYGTYNLVPEPSTWALLLFGFAFFGLRQFWPGASHE